MPQLKSRPKLTKSRKQEQALQKANARWNLFTGAVRSGKTFATLFLMLKRLKDLPEGRRAIIGKTETTIMRNILDPLQDLVGTKYVSDVEGKKREATIFGKKFYCIGANDKRATKKLKGSGFTYVLGDEMTTWPKGFFNMLKSRMDKEYSKFDGTTNPAAPTHWLKESMIDREGLDIYHQHYVLDDNPFLGKDLIEELKLEYSGVWYQRYILGEWTKAEGMIYDNFNEDNIVSSLPKNFKQFWLGIDYGTTNPTVFILLGLGIDDILYVIDEYRHAGGKEGARAKTTMEYSGELQGFLRKTADKYDDNNIYLEPKWIWVDPSEASFIQQLYRDRSSCPSLRKVREANNEVKNGIRKISTLIGLNRLKINETCHETIDEFHSYVWDSKAQSRGDDKPLKEDDHLMDALRYVVNGIHDSGVYKTITRR